MRQIYEQIRDWKKKKKKKKGLIQTTEDQFYNKE